MRACDAAVQVLRETDNPAVMCGDEGLLHLIAERLGWEHEGPRTSARVLNALSKTPGDLVFGYTQVCFGPRRRRVRIFRLPATAGIMKYESQKHDDGTTSWEAVDGK